MSKVKIYDMNGALVDDFDIMDSLLVLDKGSQAVHDVVVAFRARKRAGTASTLRKGEVAGSNKKPWRQKGTGRARAGYRQSPVWRGGGVAFGPHPRAYAKKMNKKVLRLAFRRVFSEKIAAGEIKILEELMLPEAKTGLFSLLLKSLEVSGPVLVMMDKVDNNVKLAARNIPNVEIVATGAVNVYQLLKYPLIVVNKSGMEELKTRLAN